MNNECIEESIIEATEDVRGRRKIFMERQCGQVHVIRSVYRKVMMQRMTK